MERKVIAERVFDLVSENIGAERSGLTEGTSQSDLGIDSILMVDLMLTIEDRFGFTFKSLEMPKNPTIGDIVTMIERELQAG